MQSAKLTIWNCSSLPDKKNCILNDFDRRMGRVKSSDFFAFMPYTSVNVIFYKLLSIRSLGENYHDIALFRILQKSFRSTVSGAMISMGKTYLLKCALKKKDQNRKSVFISCDCPTPTFLRSTKENNQKLVMRWCWTILK